MEDYQLPPSQEVRPNAVPESLDVTDANAPVSSYSIVQKAYPVETLEVHNEGTQGATVAAWQPTLRSVPFSRRKATIVSLVITLLVVILTGVVSALFISRDKDKPQSQQANIPNQDISFGDAPGSIPPELQGAEEALLVNGDIITRGHLKVASGDFMTVIRNQDLTANREFILPDASGTICLDANNCSNASQAQVDQQAAAIAQVQAQLGQIVIPPAGVGSLNGQSGTVAIQGTTNQVTVSTANGTITISTPQDLSNISSPTFAGLLLNGGLTVTGTITTGLDCTGNTNEGALTANASGQIICSNDDGGGGGGAPTTATYLVTALDAALTAERALAAGSNVQFTDGGANGSFTIATVQNPTFTTSVTTPTLTSTAAMAITPGGALTVGAVGQTVLLQGSTSTITSSAGNDIVLNSGDAIELQDNTNITGGLVATGTGIFQGATITIGTSSLTNGALVLRNATNAFTVSLNAPNQTIGSATVSFPDTAGSGDTLCLVILNNCAGTPQNAFITFDAPTGTDPAADSASDTLLLVDGTNITITGNAAADSITVATVVNPTFATSVTTPQLTSTGALAITPGGALTVGATGQAALLQGSTMSITSTGAGNDITLTSADQIILTSTGTTIISSNLETQGNVELGNTAADLITFTGIIQGTNAMVFEGASAGAEELTIAIEDPTGDRTYTIPDSVGNITDTFCLETLNNCAGTPQNTFTTFDAPNGTDPAADTSNDTLLLVDGTNIVITGNSGTDSITVATVANPTFATSVTTPLVTSTGTLTLTPGGAMTLGSTGQTALLQGSTATITSTGVGNDITLTSADQIILNAGGTIELQDNTNITGNLVATGTGVFQGASVTIGADAQTGTLVLYDGGIGIAAHTASLQAVSSLAQNTTFTLPDPGGASATICISTGNCAGAGGGITGSGTTNRVAKFTASGTIGDSTITDDGTNVSLTGDFTVQGGNVTLGGAAQAGTIVFQDGDGETITLQIADVAANRVYTFPDAGGNADICLSTGNCVGGGGGSAPSSAQYLTLALDGNLSAERVLTAGTNIQFTDGGANGSLTVATVNNPTFSTSVTTPILQNAGLTVSATGVNTLTFQTNSVNRATISGTGITSFNPTGADADFSIQGITDANLFYVDAGNDRVGIGTSAPTSKFEVNSGSNRWALRVGDTALARYVAIGYENATSPFSPLSAETTGFIDLLGGDRLVAGTNFAIDAEDATAPSFIVQAAAAQTADIAVFETSAGTDLMNLQADGDLAVDTNTLFVDATGNTVSIGDISTSFGITLNGNDASYGNQPSLTFGPNSNKTWMIAVGAAGNSFDITEEGGVSAAFLLGGGFRVGNTDTGNPKMMPSNTAAAPAFTFNNDENTGMYRVGADELGFSTAGTNRLTIQADGDVAFDTDVLFVDAVNNRVGINTAAPTGDLSFGNGADRTIGVITSTTGNGDDLILEAGDGLASGVTDGGRIILRPGAPNSTGTGGDVLIDQSALDARILSMRNIYGDTVANFNYIDAGVNDYTTFELAATEYNRGTQFTLGSGNGNVGSPASGASWSLVSDTDGTGSILSDNVRAFHINKGTTDTEVFALEYADGSAVFRNINDTTTAFSIQGNDGSPDTIFNIDTTNKEVEVGDSDVAGRLVISDGSSNTGTILVNATAGDFTFTIPTVTANDTFCLANLGNCFGTGTGNTLQAAYNAGNTITTTDNRNIAFTLADDTTDSDFIVDMLGTGNQIEFRDNTTPFFTATDGGNVLFQPTTNGTSAFNVKTQAGGNILTVDTTNGRVGINLGGTATPTLAGTGQGLELNGALRLSGGGSSSLMDDYSTPNGAAVGAKFNIVNLDIQSSGTQAIAAGILDTSVQNARVISAFDDRNSIHQPSIAVIASDESSSFGLSYDNSTSNAYLKSWDVSTAEAIVLRSSVGNAHTDNVDLASFSRTGVSLLQNTSITGTLDVSSTIQAGSSNVNLTLSTGFIDADALTLTAAADGGTGTFSGSGLEVRSDGVGLLQGCADLEVLKWDETNDWWECAVDNGGTNPWSTDTGVVNLVTDGDTVTIGSATAGGKLFVDGDADEIQLQIQGNGTQTTDIMVIEGSAGADYLAVQGNGDVAFDTNTLFVDESANAIALGTTSTSSAFTDNIITVQSSTKDEIYILGDNEYNMAAEGSTYLTFDRDDANGASNEFGILTGNSAGAGVTQLFTIEKDGDMIVDTNTLFVNATTNRVGIGNAAPGAALEVTGDIYLSKESARTIKLADSTTAATAGATLSILGADGVDAVGGAITIQAGDANSAGNHIGGAVTVQGGTGSGLSAGGNLNLTGGTGLSGGQVRINGGGGLVTGSIVLQNNDLNGSVGIGTTSPDARLELAGNKTQNAWGFNGIQLQASSATYTDGNTAASGTATNAAFNSFGTPTLAATNASVTTTNAATVYIQNAPAAGTNMTITNAYALWVDNGTTRLDHSSTSTTASTAQTALQVTMADTGIVTAGTDNTYGQQLTVTRTGATGGTINTYGLDISVTGDAGGTSSATGLRVSVTGADTNTAAVLQATGATASTSKGADVSNLQTNATTNGITKYGLQVTSTGNFAGLGGANTTNYGLFVDASGADTNVALGIQTQGINDAEIYGYGDTYFQIGAEGSIYMSFDDDGDEATAQEFALYGSGSEVFKIYDSGQLQGVDGSNTAPTWTFMNDLDTGIYLSAANTLGFTTGGTNRFSISNSGLIPGASQTYDLGSATAEFDELYLGDDQGIRFGLAQNSTLRYDATTDARMELFGTGASLWIEDRLSLGRQTATMNTAGAATETSIPTTSYIEITGQDNAADILTIQTTSAKEGDLVIITNLDAITVNIDQNATTKLSGGADVPLTQYDVIMLIYDGANWLQVSAVVNNS